MNKGTPADPLRKALTAAVSALRSYQYGNSSEELAKSIADFGDAALDTNPAPADPLALAIRFHEAYERLAPSFGYETRSDTKVFDPDSKNGRLMVAVCAALATEPAELEYPAEGIRRPSRMGSRPKPAEQPEPIKRDAWRDTDEFAGLQPIHPTKPAQVGCEGGDGLLRVHPESQTCDVCATKPAEETAEAKHRRLRGRLHPDYDPRKFSPQTLGDIAREAVNEAMAVEIAALPESGVGAVQPPAPEPVAWPDAGSRRFVPMRNDAAVEYESGHRCVGNGVGDFTMICPTHGPLPSFIPYMLAGAYVADKTCPLCRLVIGAVTADRRF